MSLSSDGKHKWTRAKDGGVWRCRGIKAALRNRCTLQVERKMEGRRREGLWYAEAGGDCRMEHEPVSTHITWCCCCCYPPHKHTQPSGQMIYVGACVNVFTHFPFPASVRSDTTLYTPVASQVQGMNLTIVSLTEHTVAHVEITLLCCMGSSLEMLNWRGWKYTTIWFH